MQIITGRSARPRDRRLAVVAFCIPATTADPQIHPYQKSPFVSPLWHPRTVPQADFCALFQAFGITSDR
jgi:hypothetical protein